jgi:hypothetical protein
MRHVPASSIPLRMRKVRFQIFAQRSAVMTQLFNFPQSLQASSGMIPQIRPLFRTVQARPELLFQNMPRLLLPHPF